MGKAASKIKDATRKKDHHALHLELLAARKSPPRNLDRAGKRFWKRFKKIKKKKKDSADEVVLPDNVEEWTEPLGFLRNDVSANQNEVDSERGSSCAASSASEQPNTPTNTERTNSTTAAYGNWYGRLSPDTEDEVFLSDTSSEKDTESTSEDEQYDRAGKTTSSALGHEHIHVLQRWRGSSFQRTPSEHRIVDGSEAVHGCKTEEPKPQSSDKTLTKIESKPRPNEKAVSKLVQRFEALQKKNSEEAPLLTTTRRRGLKTKREARIASLVEKLKFANKDQCSTQTTILAEKLEESEERGSSVKKQRNRITAGMNKKTSDLIPVSRQTGAPRTDQEQQGTTTSTTGKINWPPQRYQQESSPKKHEKGYVKQLVKGLTHPPAHARKQSISNISDTNSTLSIGLQKATGDIHNTLNNTSVSLHLDASETKTVSLDRKGRVSITSSKAELEGERESLAKFYKQEKALLYPLPWDPNSRLNLGDHYVNMKMEILDSTGQNKIGQSCQLEELLDPPPKDPGNGPSHVLIQGEAGYGKSTICSKIGYNWAKGIDTFAGALPCERTFLIVYRLRDLPKGSDLETELLRFIQTSSKRRLSIPEVEKELREYGGKILLVLDGFDEIEKFHQRQVVGLLKMREPGPQSVFRNAIIIVTSRPQSKKDFLDNANNSEFLSLFDKRYRLVGLSKKNIEALVSKVFLKRQYLVKSFMKRIHDLDNSLIRDLSPILIIILCQLHEGKLSSFPKNVRSMDQLLEEVIFLMAKRTNERDGYHLMEHEIRKKLEHLGEFFFRCLLENRIQMNVSEMRECLGKDFQFLASCGILKHPFSEIAVREDLLEPLHKLFIDIPAISFLNKQWSLLPNDEKRQQFLNQNGLSRDDFNQRLLYVTFQNDQKCTIKEPFTSTGIFKCTANLSLEGDEVRYTFSVFEDPLLKQEIGLSLQTPATFTEETTQLLVRFLKEVFHNVTGMETLVHAVSHSYQRNIQLSFWYDCNYENDSYTDDSDASSPSRYYTSTPLSSSPVSRTLNSETNSPIFTPANACSPVSSCSGLCKSRSVVPSPGLQEVKPQPAGLNLFRSMTNVLAMSFGKLPACNSSELCFSFKNCKSEICIYEYIKNLVETLVDPTNAEPRVAFQLEDNFLLRCRIYSLKDRSLKNSFSDEQNFVDLCMNEFMNKEFVEKYILKAKACNISITK